VRCINRFRWSREIFVLFFSLWGVNWRFYDTSRWLWPNSCFRIWGRQTGRRQAINVRLIDTFDLSVELKIQSFWSSQLRLSDFSASAFEYRIGIMTARKALFRVLKVSILVFALFEGQLILCLSEYSVCDSRWHTCQRVSSVPCDLSEPNLMGVFIYLFVHHALISQNARIGRTGILFNGSVIRCRQSEVVVW